MLLSNGYGDMVNEVPKKEQGILERIFSEK
jgi:hypothetical protein